MYIQDVERTISKRINEIQKNNNNANNDNTYLGKKKK